jgi:hypothetical protein
MTPLIESLWQQAGIVAILLVVVYTGHKGYWYWSPGVRALTTELARDRDDWRCLAVTLMRKQGIELPDGYESSQGLTLPGEGDQRMPMPKSR